MLSQDMVAGCGPRRSSHSRQRVPLWRKQLDPTDQPLGRRLGGHPPQQPAHRYQADPGQQHGELPGSPAGAALSASASCAVLALLAQWPWPSRLSMQPSPPARWPGMQRWAAVMTTLCAAGSLCAPPVRLVRCGASHTTSQRCPLLVPLCAGGGHERAGHSRRRRLPHRCPVWGGLQ